MIGVRPKGGISEPCSDILKLGESTKEGVLDESC
jgi:hypothetical protein